MLNSLAYAILSMIARTPVSGYELQKRMDLFWQVKHSQIYPLLAKLVQEELVTFELIGQSGKPDKKIYSITDKGTTLLQDFIAQHLPATPLNRDEFLIKIYAIHLTNIETAKRLFAERLAIFEEKVAYRLDVMEQIRQAFGGIPPFTSAEFGRYIMFERKLRLEQDEIAWCTWVKGLLVQSGAE